ncbi:hypothetical protein FJW07_19615 [Mesorhizobium sp. B3-1-9]|nr:hypothetical protein FJW07_19615 [Mesorhizobium sp. B3-1-9]
MDKYEVTAVVGDRAHCLSACASVIFLSARIHLMIGNAELGFHTCRIGPGLVSPECNNLLSNGTLNRGTDFGATESFLKAGADSPEEMIYVDWRAAVLWGLLGPPTYDPTLAVPSFDCDHPQSELQLVTCSDLRLSRYEASYARSMRALAKLKGQRRSQFESQLRSSLEAIAERCKASADCLLSEFGKARKAVRVDLGQRSLDALMRKIDSHQQRELVRAFIGKCSIPSTCGRVDLLDAPFEFAQANFANLFAMLVLAEAKGETPSQGFSNPKVGTSDCVFFDLCDPRIKTINWMWFSDAGARKVPRSQIVKFIEDRRATLPPQELQ